MLENYLQNNFLPIKILGSWQTYFVYLEPGLHVFCRKTVPGVLKKKLSQSMIVDFCLQSRHKNLRLLKINQENSVAELTGMLEDPIKPML